MAVKSPKVKIDLGTLKRRAQVMRAAPTKAEHAAWSALAVALRRYDVRLIFQEPVGFYIVDFMIYPQRVAVEIDGSVHRSQKEYDARRDAYLRGLGLKVFRVSNDFVVSDPKGFAKMILAACQPLRVLPPGREPAWYMPIPLRKRKGKKKPRRSPPAKRLPNALSSKAGIVSA